MLLATLVVIRYNCNKDELEPWTILGLFATIALLAYPASLQALHLNNKRQIIQTEHDRIKKTQHPSFTFPTLPIAKATQ